MSKTHRALAIVAVIVTLVMVVARIFDSPVGGWFSYAPLAPRALFSYLAIPIVLAAAAIAAPVVSTFGAVVAAQEHRWGWLVAFILLGLLGVFGAPSYFLLELNLGLALHFRTFGVPTDFYAPMILQALPGIAALIFVATSRRRARVAGAARPA